MQKESRNIVSFILIGTGCLILIIASLFIGRFDVSMSDLRELFFYYIGFGDTLPEQADIVIMDIRLPRVLAAFIVGGTLSLTGASYQGMFRNPMVSPSILGVSAGSGFGAALAILLALGSFWTQTFSFIFGTGAVLMVFLISSTVAKRHGRNLTLILTGMVVGTVFTSLISLLKYVADPYDALPSIVYWLMGSLADIEMTDLGFICTYFNFRTAITQSIRLEAGHAFFLVMTKPNQWG